MVFRVVEGNTRSLKDVDDFIKLINDPPKGLRDLFDSETDIYITRAPGRLDVMGGIADYSGSLVLEMPISEATLAGAQQSKDSRIRIVSLQPRGADLLEFEMSLADLNDGDNEQYYDAAKEFFGRKLSSHWASYAAGVFFVLHHELGIEFKHGIRIFISSRVPVGKGVSSSAALEVATMHAVCRVFDLDFDARQIAILCQKVENYIVGAACGVMDQIAASCGVEDSLISILCQPAEIQDAVRVPDEIELWGIDSGVRHSVVGADYASVRTGAFMGYRIIAQMAGFSYEQIGPARVRVNDDRWNGYLANISPDEYEGEFKFCIPETITGDEFLRKYGGTTDQVTTVHASALYPLKASTQHAIYESARVRKCEKLLKESISEKNLEILGRLMFESHVSYSACGLTEPRTDRIVELVRQNRADGLYGARITGGGSGGTVAILAARNGREAIENILKVLEIETGQVPYVFHGSSPGASRFGSIRLCPA